MTGPRVLVLSASVGEGHNSAAAALTSALRRVLPTGSVTEMCSLPSGIERLTGRLYQVAVELTPPLQNLWYVTVAHNSGVRRFYRDVVGARIGRAMADQLGRARPDVIVSTYPLATAALSWLKARGRLDVPVVAVLSDFAPHAFWVYPGVDRYVVLSESGRERMRTLAPGVPVEVCAPLTTPEFGPPTEAERRSARERHQIPEGALAVLVSAGALGLGSVRSAVRAVRAAGPPCHALVVCGRNASLAAALRREFAGHDRVIVLGWVEDMAGLMAGVDVVLNNAGGLTAGEALASGRALVLYRPIAGHGRDCAGQLAADGLAEAGTRARWLTALLQGWAVRPGLLAAAQQRAHEYAGAHRLTDTARRIVATARPRSAGPRRTRPAAPRRYRGPVIR